MVSFQDAEWAVDQAWNSFTEDKAVKRLMLREEMNPDSQVSIGGTGTLAMRP